MRLGPWEKEVPMVYSLENRVVIGVSARALFDLRVENKIYEEN